MYPFSIGVMLDSFRTDVNTALDKAQAMGAQGVQVRATSGETTPAALTPEKRRELLKAIKDRGLTVSALCGDLGQGFVSPEKNPALIEESKRILELAKDPRISPTPATPLCRRPAASWPPTPIPSRPTSPLRPARRRPPPSRSFWTGCTPPASR